MSTIIVDGKGRIIIPEDIRKKLGIRKGSELKVSFKENKAVIACTVDGRQFIERMEGFIKPGSKVQRVDPLKLKEIWMA